jgi:hypothetical protein
MLYITNMSEINKGSDAGKVLETTSDSSVIKPGGCYRSTRPKETGLGQMVKPPSYELPRHGRRS